MIPVYQNKLGFDDGNCLAACVASILHLDIAAVPDFSDEWWFEDLYRWCKEQDVGFVHFPIRHGIKTFHENSIIVNAYCVMVFRVKDSQVRHAVVGQSCLLEEPERHPEGGYSEWHWRLVVVHDPNPEGVPVTELDEVIFLVPNAGRLVLE